VGFAGELTGKQADLGIHGRDGAQLAVADINAAGGVAGCPLHLLVRDDLGTPLGARAADRELIEAGVVAIIGHMTSAQSMAAIPVIEEAEVVLLSPTTSTPALNNLDDHFFRINPPNSLEAHTMAWNILERRGLSRVAVVYDMDNAAYSNTFWTVFAARYQELGGQVLREVPFSSAEAPDFVSVMADLRGDLTNPIDKSADAEAVLIIASALDTALMAQQAIRLGWDVPLFATGWAQTEILIQNGGHAVEGMETIVSFDWNSDACAFLEFKARYQERFGRLPTFAAAQSYEAVGVLAAALEKTGGSAEGLRQALLETQDYAGLTGRLSLDKYGDVVRTQFLIAVQNGEFVTLEAIEPGGLGL